MSNYRKPLAIGSATYSGEPPARYANILLGGLKLPDVTTLVELVRRYYEMHSHDTAPGEDGGLGCPCPVCRDANPLITRLPK